MKKELLKRVWYFIWYDDSLLSWIVNVIIAFVLVKFIIYPGLGFLLGTSYPLVAVVSCSMEHNNDFENWWAGSKAWYESNGIKKEEFVNYPFKNGINQGDIMLLKSVKDIKKGDIIVFNGNSANPIIHRAVKIKETLITKGDNNAVQDRSTKEVLGKAIFRMPYFGWIKILFNGLIGEKIIKC
ncbi:signal peptidase I [Candidatus Woesearchaeota archaeon]|nr:signal peptidase I [Candidatus Woesearchaeota archaeon]